MNDNDKKTMVLSFVCFNYTMRMTLQNNSKDGQKT